MKYFKPAITILALLAVVYVLIFGPRADVPPVHDRVIVQYWEKWTGNEAGQMQKIVDAFNDTVGKDKGIYVQYLSMSNINQKTLVSTAGGVPPDIAGLWNHQVAQYATLGALEPLDELARAYGITQSYYKPVFWKACTYQGTLYALISTPMSMGLHYNKQIVAGRADDMRRAGLDPDRLPVTLDELDRWAAALDVVEKTNSGRERIKVAGYIPMEPGWFINFTGKWFGVSVLDEQTGKLQLNHPQMIKALAWIQGYSQRLGIESMGEFRSGFGQFNSTQNPFLTGAVAMVQQGPWMANYIENLRPEMNRWNMPPERQKLDEQLAGEVASGKLASEDRMLKWAALVPAQERRKYCAWGFVPFPAAVPGLKDVSYCGFDTLVIPSGAAHPKEAFEFIAFVNRQDVMERLCSMHCKNSPLAKASEKFLNEHPNPYIAVFNELADSPNAFGDPQVGIWPRVNDEISFAIQRVYLMQATPQQALDDAQARMAEAYEKFLDLQKRRMH